MYEPDHDLIDLIERNGNLNAVGEELFSYDLGWAEIGYQAVNTAPQAPVKNPVFITGTGRTASGFLHNLMRTSGFRVASVAEGFSLVPNPAPEIVADIDRHIRLGDEQSPEYAMVNPHQWYDPAEDIHFDRSSFASPWWLCHYSGILDWAMNRMFANPIGDLEHLRACAGVLGAVDDRWCFRATTYLMRLEYLFEVFPDATVIWMERNVAEVEPSLRKMLRAMRLTRSEVVDEDEIAMLANSMATVGPMVAEQAISEGKVPLDQIIRVSFEDIVENSEATLANLLTRLNIEQVNPSRLSVE